ncbi:extensin [Streptomyces sp. NPDC047081]|uniref:extensin n=1 Tax=Streptomyces sp. NPDC047081 TaxID=3154706 RepID=UPI0033FC04F8
MKHIAAREAIGLLRSMTWVLCTVALLALVFTTVNVTRFAASRGVPWPIAILLDPMIGTALAGVLYVDARLASWGIRPPAWSTALRWGAGCTAALMNAWESLWPDGQIGLPRRADPAAVLLHLTPALLLIALTETIAAYRRTVTDLLEQIGIADPVEQHLRHPVLTAGSGGEESDTDATAPDPSGDRPSQGNPDHRPAIVGTPVPRNKGRAEPRTGDQVPHGRSLAAGSPSAENRATDADVWPRAVALNDAARSASGKPVSIWRLRTDLRIGPRRARQIRDQLLAHEADRSLPPG